MPMWKSERERKVALIFTPVHSYVIRSCSVVKLIVLTYLCWKNTIRSSEKPIWFSYDLWSSARFVNYPRCKCEQWEFFCSVLMRYLLKDFAQTHTHSHTQVTTKSSQNCTREKGASVEESHYQPKSKVNMNVDARESALNSHICFNALATLQNIKNVENCEYFVCFFWSFCHTYWSFLIRTVVVHCFFSLSFKLDVSICFEDVRLGFRSFSLKFSPMSTLITCILSFSL